MAYELKGDAKALEYYTLALKLCKFPAEEFGIYRSVSIIHAKAGNFKLATENI